MTDYTELVRKMRTCIGDKKCFEKECRYWSELGCMDGNICCDAAAAIEALQAEYEREKRRADMYAELFDIMRKSRNEIIEQIGRVKGVPDFALYYPEYNLCANYPKKTDSSESPNS